MNTQIMRSVIDDNKVLILKYKANAKDLRDKIDILNHDLRLQTREMTRLNTINVAIKSQLGMRG